MKLQARLNAGLKVREVDLELTGCGENGHCRFRADNVALLADAQVVSPGIYSILVDGRSYAASVSQAPGNPAGSAGAYTVLVGSRRYVVELRDPRRWRGTSSASAAGGPQDIVAPMPGRIVRVLVKEGEEVERDQGLLVIEAMKMQNELRAPRTGRVERVLAAEGQGVESGALLLLLGRRHQANP